MNKPLEGTADQVSTTQWVSTTCAVQERVDDIASLPLGTTNIKSNITTSKFRTIRLQLVTIAMSFALLAVVITYVQATYAAQRSSQQGLRLSSLLKTEASTTLTILRASQGLLSLLTALALDGAFVLLQWNNMAHPQGLPYLTLLSMSPPTAAWGLIGIMKSGVRPISPKIWAALRRVYEILMGVLDKSNDQ